MRSAGLVTLVAAAAAAAAALLVASTSAQPVQLDQELIVPTAYGSVWGDKWDLGRAFRGVPYAAPPVGRQGRWQPPTEPRAWGSNDPLMTRDYAPGCIQRCTDGIELPPHNCPQKISEDCLYLNVYTPHNVDDTSNLPVMVFFHGGNFDKGMPNILYEGLYLANQTGVVVVTVAYRLGALGFLVAPGLNGGEVQNLGIKDQRFALQWVQSNIVNFGGNPNLVTIFGQSAGGRSVSTHLVSKYSRGLFHRAIIHSDPLTIVASDKQDALELADRFGEAVNCDMSDTDCLYLLTTDEIIAGQEAAVKYIPIDEPISAFMQILPSVDGDDITEQPFNLFSKGDFAQVPIIIGTVSEEAVLYINMGWPNPVLRAEYMAVVKLVFRDNATEILDLYPPIEGPDADQRPNMFALGTDYVFTCPNRYVARNLAAHTNTYRYVFDHAFSFPAWGDHYDYCVGYVCHGSELPFAFNTAQIYFSIPEEEKTLAQTMVEYWGTFARTGNPNIAGQPNWPLFNAAGDADIRLTTPASYSGTGFRQEYCDVLDQFGYDPMRKENVARIFLRKPSQH